MAKVQLIDGRIVDAQITNVSAPDEEGSRRATAHFDGNTYPVYKSIIDGFTDIWNEQMSWETYKMLQGTGAQFVEGSVTTGKDASINPAPGVGTTIDHLYLDIDRQPVVGEGSQS